MKAVIIGAGIAGLAAAKSFREKGWEVVVTERAEKFAEVGLGFIIMPNGLEALDLAGAGDYIRKNGNELNTAKLRTCDGNVFKEEKLENTVAVKRSTCIEALKQLSPENIIKTGFEFSHFETNDQGHATTAVFKNGEKISADIFIAADGANSKIRKMLFSEHRERNCIIKELVGIAENKALAQQLKGQLLKTINFERHLSIGLLPCNDHQIIWYLQFNNERYPLNDLSNEGKKQFVEELVTGWPDPIAEVIHSTPFDLVFLWQTKDMDLLPAFHKNNVVLIGDAAHLALPFTSQGTNSALNDASLLAELLENVNQENLDGKLVLFYEKRKPDLLKYIEFGRKLETLFLNPSLYCESETPIPLAK